MRTLGFTPQRPLKRAYEQNSVLVESWRGQDLPQRRHRDKKVQALLKQLDGKDHLVFPSDVFTPAQSGRVGLSGIRSSGASPSSLHAQTWFTTKKPLLAIARSNPPIWLTRPGTAPSASLTTRRASRLTTITRLSAPMAVLLRTSRSLCKRRPSAKYTFMITEPRFTTASPARKHLQHLAKLRGRCLVLMPTRCCHTCLMLLNRFRLQILYLRANAECAHWPGRALTH
jgi:hypothetical protein